MHLDRIARVTQMEFFLGEITKAKESLQEQVERVKLCCEQAKKLYSYYGSEDWYKDRQEELQEGMRAGVLSEDTFHDSMTALRDTAFEMLELGTDVLKNWI